jgi:hypothetical protein
LTLKKTIGPPISSRKRVPRADLIGSLKPTVKQEQETSAVIPIFLKTVREYTSLLKKLRQRLGFTRSLFLVFVVVLSDLFNFRGKTSSLAGISPTTGPADDE